MSLLWALGKLPQLELRGSMGVFKYRVPAMHFMIVLAYDLISFYFSIKARHSTLRLRLCTERYLASHVLKTTWCTVIKQGREC